MPTVWRITHQKFLSTAFDGTGAAEYGGRWNHPGTEVVYTSSVEALALLEILAHLKSTRVIKEHYVLVPASIEEKLIEVLDPKRLPSNWRNFPGPSELRDIGTAWAKGPSPKGGVITVPPFVGLRVPSVLSTTDTTVLLNPNHPGFATVKIGKPVPIEIDERLLP